MRDISVSLTGNVATAPTFVSGGTRGGGGSIFFRVAANPTWFDRSRGVWMERDPEYFSVFVRGQQAENVYDSVHPGEPVFVAGRLSSGEYSLKGTGEVVRGNTVNAETVGHALTFGTTKWTKVTRDSGQAQGEASSDSEPAAGSDEEAVPGPGEGGLGESGPASIITSVPAEEPAGASASAGGTAESGTEGTPF